MHFGMKIHTLPVGAARGAVFMHKQIIKYLDLYMYMWSFRPACY